MRTLRFLLAIPLGFVASLLAGALGNWFQTMGGESAWWAWSFSGILSAVAFFGVANAVAPGKSSRLKWALVMLVSVLGAMATLGPLLRGQERVQALAGVAMIAIAAVYARKTSGSEKPAPELSSQAVDG